MIPQLKLRPGDVTAPLPEGSPPPSDDPRDLEGFWIGVGMKGLEHNAVKVRRSVTVVVHPARGTSSHSGILRNITLADGRNIRRHAGKRGRRRDHQVPVYGTLDGAESRQRQFNNWYNKVHAPKIAALAGVKQARSSSHHEDSPTQNPTWRGTTSRSALPPCLIACSSR